MVFSLLWKTTGFCLQRVSRTWPGLSRLIQIHIEARRTAIIICRGLWCLWLDRQAKKRVSKGTMWPDSQAKTLFKFFSLKPIPPQATEEGCTEI
jgi:hypothetical protein